MFLEFCVLKLTSVSARGDSTSFSLGIIKRCSLYAQWIWTHIQFSAGSGMFMYVSMVVCLATKCTREQLWRLLCFIFTDHSFMCPGKLTLFFTRLPHTSTTQQIYLGQYVLLTSKLTAFNIKIKGTSIINFKYSSLKPSTYLL